MRFSPKPTAPLACGAAIVMGGLVGCGGSGGSVASTYNLTPNQAVRAASLSSYKSASTGAAFTYRMVRLASPSSSLIHMARLSKAPVTLEPITGLYLQDPVKGADGTYTINMFVDAAGTDAAGKMTYKPPADFPNYASYPVAVPITINVTKGAVPCVGSATLTFSGSSGANQLVGDLKLTKDSIDYHFDMGLTNSLDVTGSIRIQENGQTIEATNLNGPALGSIACDVLVKPTNWTGTGSLKLADGKVKLTLDTPPNTSGCDFDNNGNLVIDNPDGTTTTVTQPISKDLTNTNDNGGGGGGGTGAFLEPVQITGPSGFGIVRVLGTGQMTGFDSAGNALYWASVGAAPSTLKVRVAGSKVNAQGLAVVNGKVQIVGFETVSGVIKPLIWKDVTQAPTLLSVTSTGKALGINASGKAVGAADGKPVVWDTVAGGAPTALKTAPYTITRATHIANNGVIADIEVGTPPITWASSTADPRLRASVDGIVSDTVLQANDMNIANGHLVGRGTVSGGYPVGLFFKCLANGDFVVKQINQIATVNNNGGYAFGIGDDETIVGIMNTDAGAIGVFWKDGPSLDPTDINTKLPAGTTWQIIDIGWKLNDGTMIAFGNKTGGPANAAVAIKPAP